MLVAAGETVILLHPPLPLAGASIAMERGCQTNDSLGCVILLHPPLHLAGDGDGEGEPAKGLPRRRLEAPDHRRVGLEDGGMEGGDAPGIR